MTTGKEMSAVLQAMLPHERRAAAVIALVGMCRMFGLFALLPVLALHAADLQGATPVLVDVDPRRRLANRAWGRATPRRSPRRLRVKPGAESRRNYR